MNPCGTVVSTEDLDPVPEEVEYAERDIECTGEVECSIRRRIDDDCRAEGGPELDNALRLNQIVSSERFLR